MATPPDSPTPEDVLFDFESTCTRQQTTRPVAIDELLRQTKFSRGEIRVMYRGFKQGVSDDKEKENALECPEGVVHEDSFKDIYAKFFPHGNSSYYAHHVYKAFDINCKGSINFRDLLVTLSTLLRGSLYEKLRWTFNLYDINGDGCITREELGQVVTAVHELMGRKHPFEEERKAREQLDRVFEKLDLNRDGIITIEEFIESCLKDEVITQSLMMFNCEL